MTPTPQEIFFATLQKRPFDEIHALEQIAAGIDVNAPTPQGWTPLMSAAMAGHADVIEFLLLQKADPNKSRTFDGNTPLSYAAGHGHRDCCLALLAAGADPNTRMGADLETALIWMARWPVQHEKMMILLMEHGANPELANAAGIKAADLWQKCENSDVVARLDAAERKTPQSAHAKRQKMAQTPYGRLKGKPGLKIR